MNDYQRLYRNLHKDTQISGPKFHLLCVGNFYIDELSSYGYDTTMLRSKLIYTSSNERERESKINQRNLKQYLHGLTKQQ